MMLALYSNWPLNIPACSTSVSTLPTWTPAHRNWKLSRLPRPEPPLMNGPYSQLWSWRTWATGLSTPAGPLAAAAPGVWAEAIIVPAIKRNITNLALGVNVLPFFLSNTNDDSHKKAATTGRPVACLPGAALAGRLFHLLGVHVEVRVDVLCVVALFQGLEQADHLVCCSPFQLGIGGRDHGHFAHHRGNARGLHCLGNRFIGGWFGDDLPGVALVVQVFPAMLQHDI